MVRDTRLAEWLGGEREREREGEVSTEEKGERKQDKPERDLQAEGRWQYEKGRESEKEKVLKRDSE